jgi:structural maintenance of chromosome 4
VKEGEDSNDMIPKLEDNIPKLQKLLLDEEKVLEEITESSKGRPFSFFTTDTEY